MHFASNIAPSLTLVHYSALTCALLCKLTAILFIAISIRINRYETQAEHKQMCMCMCCVYNNNNQMPTIEMQKSKSFKKGCSVCSLHQWEFIELHIHSKFTSILR